MKHRTRSVVLGLMCTLVVQAIPGTSASLAPSPDADPAAGQEAQGRDARPSVLAETAVLWVRYLGNVRDVMKTPPTDLAQIDHVAGFMAAQTGGGAGRSWLAMAGMAAARNDLFAASVRAAAADKGREAYLDDLAARPWTPAQLNGARQGMALAAAVLQVSEPGPALERVRSYSYSLQNTPWAKAVLTDNSQALAWLAEASALETPPHPAVVAVADEMFQIGDISLPNRAPGTPYFPGPLPRIIRDGVKEQIMLLAAYRVLGADRDRPEQVRAALGLARSRSCFAAAALNMRQCVSANRRPYERIACIGQHQLEEPYRCAERDVGQFGVSEALAALSRPTHAVLKENGSTLALSRAPVGSAASAGALPAGVEAEIIEVVGLGEASWLRLRYTSSSPSATVDGWVRATDVRTLRRADTPD
jgi:hypothetical protein